MKILMMSNTYTPIMGGLEKSIQAFTRQFRRRRHKVTIVCPEIEGQPKKEKDVLRIPAIQHVNGTDFAVNLPIPGLLSDLMENFRPDIVHAHHPFLVGDMALRLCGQYHIPLVFTYHTMFEQYTDFFESEAGKSFVTELAAGFANMADHVIVPSESVRDVLLERGVEAPIDIVPTGVDIVRFSKGNGLRIRKELGIPENAFVAGHVGRLAPEKNLEFLGEAAARFLKEETKARLLIGGKGPSEEKMKEIFGRHGVSDRVHMAGMLKGQDLIDAYHAMDAFVFASRSETQGMVLTEAMSASVPVIGLDAPGVREVVRDKENGRLLKEEDAQKFASAIAWCAKLKGAELKEVQGAAFKTAEKFSISRTAEKMLRVYGMARLRNKRHKDKADSPWHIVMGRIKTEMEMLGNLGKAAGAAAKAALTGAP